VSRASVLLVEDNKRIQLANRDMFEILGYDVTIAMSLAEARRCFAERTPDVIVLDIMMPDGSGLDFLREARRRSSVPVLLLTALGTPDDTVRGLASGADDYVSKPYDYKVLAARIDALLRRSRRVSELVRKGPLELDVLAARAFQNGEDMRLKPKEFALLLLMAQNEGAVMSAKRLYETLWKMPFADDSQAVRTVVSRLRAKLSGTGYTITFERGELNELNKSGYCFQLEEE
jgi:DNA-binding response OmpR family regulator